MDIYLKQAVMQIINRESGMPVFSQSPLDLTTEYIRDFLTKKIVKISSPQTKTGILVEDSEVALLAKESPENFIAVSERLTQRWFDVYNLSEDSPSGNVFIVLYEEDTVMHLAFLKVNYQESFTHFVDSEEGMVQNKLIINRALLGSKTGKADEALTINLNDLSYQLIEKRYTFSGEKKYYFSEAVIDTTPAPSLEENVRVIKKVAKQIGKKFEEDEFEVLADVKEAMYDSIEESGYVAAEKVAKKVFKDNISAQMAFQEEVKEAGFVEESQPLKEVREISEKRFGKQKFKLSNGIELIVPVDVYRDSNLIEFINNPDGTVSVMIKNIDEVINRL
ncbi:MULTISPECIES: nucleoid-associated protein [unclassified Enterococcus]|uniref:nucleoid-associated protein n=1 Tax=unclassified Enterococcus TaxID=2608891 RepID=UPI0024761712|nr:MULTISPECIES: nucleoid-associated protein [unclassified Enterococcus]